MARHDRARPVAALLCGLWVLAALGAAGCGPGRGLRDTVASKESQVKSLRSQIAAAGRGGGSSDQGYLASLRGGAGAERAYHLGLPPAELARAAAALLPYSFDARSVHKDISGTMTVVAASNFRMGEANRLTFRLTMKGQGLQYHGSTAGMGAHIAKVKAGLAAGMDVDVRARVWVEGGAVKVKLLATAVQLRKNASSQYHKTLKGALNKYLFKPNFTIQTGSLQVAGKRVQPYRVLVTPNQVVLSLR